MTLHRSQPRIWPQVCRAGARFGLLAAVLAVAIGRPSTDAPAQQPPPAAKKAPAAAAAGGPNSDWVKVCEKTPVGTMFKDGKEETRFSNYCVTQHELIDGNVGRAIMSAAVRQMDGEPTQYLMVMMPLNVNLKAGMRGALYPKDLWEPAQRNEKIDESKLKGIGLEYNICHKGGCTAQVEVTPQLLNDLKTFGGIAVFAVSDRGEAVSFPVPLAGFAQAYASAGIDSRQFAAARQALVQRLAQRQRELADQQKKQAPQQPAAAAPGSPPAAKK
jgi:invasion protein IalB